jgi:hypothetical protein
LVLGSAAGRGSALGGTGRFEEREMTIRPLGLQASFVALGFALVWATSGCDVTEEEIGNDPTGSGPSGTAQGAGGTGGASSQGGGPAQGSGGTGPGTGGSGSGGATCHGDDAQWASVTQSPIACTKNSDCCVVLNFCLSAAQVVHASNVSAAKDSWPYCESECNDCIPPEVTVFCLDQQCVGVSVEEPTGDPADHCGIDGMPGTGGTTGEHFGCG